MKKAIKKITAAALAFTLLGTGTVISKNVSPKSTAVFTSHAEFAHNCSSYKTGPFYINQMDRYAAGAARIFVIQYYRCAVCGREWVA